MGGPRGQVARKSLTGENAEHWAPRQAAQCVALGIPLWNLRSFSDLRFYKNLKIPQTACSQNPGLDPGTKDISGKTCEIPVKSVVELIMMYWRQLLSRDKCCSYIKR